MEQLWCAGMELELKYLAWLFAASSNIKTSEQQAKTGQKPLEHDFNANKGGEGERERGGRERERVAGLLPLKVGSGAKGGVGLCASSNSFNLSCMLGALCQRLGL